jgi:hypothetical protein
MNVVDETVKDLTHGHMNGAAKGAFGDLERALKAERKAQAKPDAAARSAAHEDKEGVASQADTLVKYACEVSPLCLPVPEGETLR